ncbi:hypothetical protein P154DRAFT_18006 [Amniculicola lignicola CBS 123094]|uniref:Uncharacterized protein n=1 Tax=Amniculicola lignicola CBS 123094 TaxID=1392246 RepID=A0A6A5X5I4_9PLEO|nr:hypothetical protein P154DRAFT_18006 [Amniculicola lignicola CBS 123094]
MLDEGSVQETIPVSRRAGWDGSLRYHLLPPRPHNPARFPSGTSPIIHIPCHNAFLAILLGLVLYRLSSASGPSTSAP